jgi:hypothetical protein
MLRSFRVCLMKLDALMLGAYKLIIVISFLCISPFFSMACPSLSQCKFDNVSLKSALSEYCYLCLFLAATGLVNLLPAFHPKPGLFLLMRWVFCK